MENDVRWINPSQFLTRSEMIRALSMYVDAVTEGRSDFAQRLAEEVIRPNLQRIKKVLGPEIDPVCLAESLETAIKESVEIIKGARTEGNSLSSFQVALCSPQEPRFIKSAITFPTRAEAQAWGEQAAQFIRWFVSFEELQVIEIQEPPTHAYQDGRLIMFGTDYKC